MLVTLADVPRYGAIATGLTPLQLAVVMDKPVQGCRLSVILDDRGEPACTIDLPASPLTRLSLTLCSHLLTDGPATVHAVLTTPDGNEANRLTQSFVVRNPGPLAERVRANLVRNGNPVVTDKPCDSTDYDYADTSLLPWYDKPDAMQHIDMLLANGAIDPVMAEHFRHFVINGFIRLDEFVEAPLLAEIRTQMDAAVAEKYQGYEWGSSQRLEQLHRQPGGINKLWRHQGIADVLTKLLEQQPRFCQTLTYVFGSQQDAHQDTIHLTPFPAGYMCGVWTAIDDVLPDSGELVVYPGSHRFQRVMMHDVDCAKVTDGNWKEFGAKVGGSWRRLYTESGIEPYVYRPKAGTVLIWHENLMHAGSVRKDKSLSRRSVVSHVFGDGALAFYDSSGTAGYIHPIEQNSSESARELG